MNSQFLSAKHLYFSLVTVLVFLSSCSTTKESSSTSGMQNLTARFNILYNARIKLDESERDLRESFSEDPRELLPIFAEPSAIYSKQESGNLDSVISRAQLIIHEKSKSNYVGDAFLLLARANYLKSNFFDAAEFFDYTAKTYNSRSTLRQPALIGRARASFHLNQLTAAADAIDSAIKYAPSDRRSRPYVFAAQAQLYIKKNEPQLAIGSLQKALKLAHTESDRIRWTYILGQLLQMQGHEQQAIDAFEKVTRTNASYDLGFNARLRLLSLEGKQSHNAMHDLQLLLDDERNKDFADQIYFRMGEEYEREGQVQQGLSAYNQAVSFSTRNQTQKAFAYLRLATLHAELEDYKAAEAYYDKTLNTLDPSHPDYNSIFAKRNNLLFVAPRLQTVKTERELQAIARLPKAERELRLRLLSVRDEQEKGEDSGRVGGAEAAGSPSSLREQANGAFYFDNPSTVSSGRIEFRRRWGNRKLQDNWRRNSTSMPTATTDFNQLSTNPDEPTGVQGDVNKSVQNSIENLRAKVPDTEAKLAQSELRIENAWYELGTFYKSQDNGREQAIGYFTRLLKEYPGSQLEPATLYSLFQLYAKDDENQSRAYKQLLFQKAPNSVFAKLAANSNYLQKDNEKEDALNRAYEAIYNLYTAGKFASAIGKINEVESQYGRNKLSAQLRYLKALAVGRTDRLAPFESILNDIVARFPEDKLITPLATQNLAYIDAKRAELNRRFPVLLPDEFVEEVPKIKRSATPARLTADRQTPAGASEIGRSLNSRTNHSIQKPEDQKAGQALAENLQTPSAARPEAEAGKNSKPALPGISRPDDYAAANSSHSMQENKKTFTPPVQKAPEKISAAGASPARAQTAEKPARAAERELFTLPDTAEYYFVVNVMDATVNLSPSRFGIGQFNRTRYQDSGLKHELKQIDNENQLILVGKFLSKDEAKSYERNILPLVPEIMKVGIEKYNTFVVCKQVLDKLNTRAIIDSYLSFYRKGK